MMKLNQLTVLVLGAAVSALAQTSAPPAQPPAQTTTTTTQQPGQSTTSTTTTAQPQQQPAQPQQKKEIKDPAEYNSYISAIGMSNPAQKAQALEQFLQQYPNTVVKTDALQQLMGAYQQANNGPKAVDAAGRLSQADPNNVFALFILTVSNRATNPAQGGQYGVRGLQTLPNFTKPEGMAADTFEKLKRDFEGAFSGAAGFGALQQKDYPNAQKYLGAAVQANPDDLQNVYPLAVAYLQTTPLNPLGFWYGARAIHLSANNAAANAQITKYVQAKYHNYHGGDDGWQQLLQQAAASPNPPAGFSVTQETPAIQAKKMIQANPDPKKMDFGTLSFIFQNADPADAEQVWNGIKGVNMQFKANVISVQGTTLMLASTADAIQANQADMQVTMAAAIPPKLMPKVGGEVGLQAAPVSYDKSPYLLHMGEGKLLVSKVAPGTRRKPPVRRRRPAR